jgi:hypothetical protein
MGDEPRRGRDRNRPHMLRTTDPIKVKVRGGFSLLDMMRFLESRGFVGIGNKNLSFDELLVFDAPVVPIDFYGIRTSSLCAS